MALAPAPLDVNEAAGSLDNLVPGWADQIDLEQLDLNDPFDCILGQLLRGQYYTYEFQTKPKSAYQQEWFKEDEEFFASGPFGFKFQADWEVEVKKRKSTI